MYSLFALKGILPEEHLQCWRFFVLACKTLGKRVLTGNDIEIGDKYLMQFCKTFETLYGKDLVTPNMHLHGNLKECLLDYGPFHSFWCFSFERFNGILGSYHTNNRSIEIQLMRKFLMQTKVKDFSYPEKYQDSFMEFFDTYHIPYRERLVPQLNGQVILGKQHALRNIPLAPSFRFALLEMCATIPSLATTSLYPSFAHCIKSFLTYFEVLFVLAEMSCPQTTATFTINIKVSDDVVECYVDVNCSTCPDWCFAKWTFGDIYREIFLLFCYKFVSVGSHIRESAHLTI